MASSAPSPRYCHRLRAAPAIILLLGVFILPEAAALVTPIYHQRHHQRSCRQRYCRPAAARTCTSQQHFGLSVLNGDIAVADGSSDESAMQVDEFQPQTKTIAKSIAFFCAYVVRTVQQSGSPLGLPIAASVVSSPSFGIPSAGEDGPRMLKLEGGKTRRHSPGSSPSWESEKAKRNCWTRSARG